MKRSALFGYGILALPLAFAGLPLYVHAPDFYATQLGLPLAGMGVILLVLRLVDAVQDPLLGYLSDRLQRGRAALVGAGALLVVLGFVALFRPPPDAGLGWFAGAMLLATTAFSLVSINLNALGGLWRTTTHGRTLITATREGASVCGLLLAVLLPAALQLQMAPAQAFELVSILLVVLMAPATVLFLRWYRAHSEETQAEAVQQLPAWLRLRDLPHFTRRFYLACGLSMLASAIPTVLVLFFIRDRLDAEQYAGFFLGIYFLAAALAMPLWSRLSVWLGKRRAWLLSMAVAMVCFVWAVLLGPGDVGAYALICLLSGLAFGAELALPPSMLADQLQRYGLRAQAGMHFSVLTFLAKLALALGSALSFGLLELADFRAGGPNTATALLTLSACYALLPCLIKGIAMMVLFRLGDTNENADHDRSAGLRGYA